MNKGYIIGGPQKESRVVSCETEIEIPNKAGATIAVCVAGWAFIYFMSGHVFGPLVPAIILGLSTIVIGTSLTWWGIRRISDTWNLQVNWEAIKEMAMLILSLAIFVTTVAFYAMRAWYASVPFWKEILLELALGFVGGSAPLVYFHYNNTINPNWPPPYWWQRPPDDEETEAPPLLPLEVMGSIEAPDGL